MVIDLNENIISYDNYVCEYKVKTSKLLTEVNQINLEMKHQYNYIIMPISIYNIIEQSEYFTSSKYEENKQGGLSLVGWLGQFECYLDIHLEPCQIILSWDKAKSRELKIESILSNCKNLVKEKKIKVLP